MLEEYDDILSVRCVCEILGISKTTALKLLNNGTIKAVKVGKQWRITKESIIVWLK